MPVASVAAGADEAFTTMLEAMSLFFEDCIAELDIELCHIPLTQLILPFNELGLVNLGWVFTAAIQELLENGELVQGIALQLQAFRLVVSLHSVQDRAMDMVRGTRPNMIEKSCAAHRVTVPSSI